MTSDKELMIRFGMIPADQAHCAAPVVPAIGRLFLQWLDKMEFYPSPDYDPMERWSAVGESNDDLRWMFIDDVGALAGDDHELQDWLEPYDLDSLIRDGDEVCDQSLDAALDAIIAYPDDATLKEFAAATIKQLRDNRRNSEP